MDSPSYFLCVKHVKSRQQLTLIIPPGNTYSVGRADGSTDSERWSIPFDPALSRDHFQATVLSGKLLIEATKNRHPIHFDGKPRENFLVLVGQSFSTAHLTFEFGSSSIAPPPPDRLSTPPVLPEPGQATGPETRVIQTRPVKSAAPPGDSRQELLMVTGMFSILINRGVGFGRIFELLSTHVSSPLRPLINGLEKAVLQDKEPLSRAVLRYPEFFSESYGAMIELGESTDLGKVFNRLYLQIAREHLKRHPFSGPSLALAGACRNIGDLLDAGNSPSGAFGLAAKAATDEQVRQGFQDLAAQTRSGKSFSECRFPEPLFTPIFSGLLAAHEEVGSGPKAFKDLADLLEARL